ncbi:MAG TPA: cytochrome c biogenesis CcdA family protein [Candidatus Stackebrandtia faecavium]|nr:cytochrome c biogenesis CcdA family protein [Candidatus Stackebrandtia faecavium]
MSIGYLGAFVGGVLSLLSPCSAMLVPSFFAYAFSSRVKLAARTGVFYLGLLTTFVPMGVAAGSVGAVLNSHRDTVIIVGGVLLIALGIAQILGFGFGSTAAQSLSGRIRVSSNLSVYLLGTVYGLAGFCAGPLLGGVLTMAMTGGSPVYGALLLSVYALGMAVPLWLLAALWDRFDLGRKRWLRGRPLSLGPLHVHSTTLIAGLIFIALGVLFLLSEGTGALSSIMSTDSQFALQSWVQSIDESIPTGVVVGVIAAAALAASFVLWRRWGRSKQTE